MTVLAIDFETAWYARESAIALGISVIDDGEVRETRHWLFRPPGKKIYIRPDFIDIHGIQPEHLEDKLHFDGYWDDMRPYFDDAHMLVAHNIGCDRTVLHAVAAHYGIPLPDHQWRCTVNISRATWPGLPNHKLPTVAAHLDIPLNHHDAASDAEACARIYIEAMRQKGESAVA